MVRRLNLTNKNSNEIYTLHYPKNLLGFMKFDFTVFMERSTDLCRLYMKTGGYKQEEVLEVRNSIISCHKFVEQNIRSVFDKIVVDCWIEYICRLNEIGTVTLWNNFIPCRTDFEKAIFSRLSEYRHNTAVNQWVNILKIQEYAKTKTEFIFGQPLKNLPEAVTKSNYFDLMFNVAANELGYDVSDIAGNRIYSLGRTPNSPYIMSNISREIVRSMFSDVKYFDDTKHKPKKGDFVTDQTAMDAFSAIKSYIPSENDLALGTMIKALSESSQKVYIPSGFKAVIDLEIDAILDSEAILQRCGRCREFFLRSEEYDHEYCDRVNREGKSCFEIMNGVSAAEKKEKAVDATLISMRCDQLYREMLARVNVDLTQRDFSDWYKYMMLIRDNTLSGEATLDDFDNFVEYSRSMAFPPRQNKEKEETKNESDTDKHGLYDEHGRVVKPFVFEKIDRSVLKNTEQELYFPEKPAKRNGRSEYRDDYEASPYPYQQMTAPAPKRIIRGISAEAYENTFDNNVVIPYGIGQTQNQARETPPNRTVNDAQNPISPVTPALDVKAEEDDIKIYNIKNAVPEQKREFVKVFEPSKRRRRVSSDGTGIIASSGIPSLNADMRAADMRKDTLDSFLQNSSAAAEREFEAKREAETEKSRGGKLSPSLTPSAPATSSATPPATPPAAGESANTETARIREPRPENKVSYAANVYKNTGTPIVPTPQNTAQQRKYPQSEIAESPESAESHEGQSSDFTNALLKNIERKDGFETSVPTDAEGMPLSHKTKRVMDAIFKPSKPSLFININKDE